MKIAVFLPDFLVGHKLCPSKLKDSFQILQTWIVRKRNHCFPSICSWKDLPTGVGPLWQAEHFLCSHFLQKQIVILTSLVYVSPLYYFSIFWIDKYDWFYFSYQEHSRFAVVWFIDRFLASLSTCWITAIPVRLACVPLRFDSYSLTRCSIAFAVATARLLILLVCPLELGLGLSFCFTLGNYFPWVKSS